MEKSQNICDCQNNAFSAIRRHCSEDDALDKLRCFTSQKQQRTRSTSLTDYPHSTCHVGKTDYHAMARNEYKTHGSNDKQRVNCTLLPHTLVNRSSKRYDGNDTTYNNKWDVWHRKKSEVDDYNNKNNINRVCNSHNTNSMNKTDKSNNVNIDDRKDKQHPTSCKDYIYSFINDKFSSLKHIEVSYSSTLLFFWALLLVYISCNDHFYAHGITILALSSVALTSRHGQSRLLLPLVFLSQLCLARTLHRPNCELQFYASMLLSYISLLIHQPQTGSRGPLPAITGTARKWLFVLVGVALVCSVLQQPVILIGMLAYVVIGGSFYWRLEPLLGNNEAILVSSFVGFVFCDACTNNNLSLYGGTTSILHLVHTNAELTTSPIHVASRNTMVFAAAMMLTLSVSSQYCLVPIAANSKSSGKRFSQTRMTIVFWTSVVLYTSLLCVITSYQFRQNVIVWLVKYLLTDKFRAYTLLLWFICIPTIIIVGDYLTRSLRKTVRRKLFHLIAVLAFTPAALVEPSFLAFALSTATSIAVVVETARVFHVYGTDVISTFTSKFIDDRDSITGVVRTHIYLLFGLGISVFMQYRYTTSGMSKCVNLISNHFVRHSHYKTCTLSSAQVFMEMCINMIPGIISLGVVDASAAIIGSSFLRTSRRVLGRYLKNNIFTERANTSITHKTTTGTLGGLLCGVIFWLCLIGVQRIHFALPVLYSFSMIVVCSLTECFMDGVDNLQMPLVALGAVNSLFALLIPKSDLWSSLP